jgi:hypothetical protein
MSIERTAARPESRESAAQADATRNFQHEARTLYGCGNGAIVSKPSDCRAVAALPSLSITDESHDYASRTYRRGDDGYTSDGGKVEKV